MKKDIECFFFALAIILILCSFNFWKQRPYPAPAGSLKCRVQFGESRISLAKESKVAVFLKCVCLVTLASVKNESSPPFFPGSNLVIRVSCGCSWAISGSPSGQLSHTKCGSAWGGVNRNKSTPTHAEPRAVSRPVSSWRTLTACIKPVESSLFSLWQWKASPWRSRGMKARHASEGKNSNIATI